MNKKEQIIEKIINKLSFPNSSYAKDSGYMKHIEKGFKNMNNTSLENLLLLLRMGVK